jgi:DNA-binding NarL/FixJ family response regulator
LNQPVQKTKKIQTVIVSRPGVMQEALRAGLASASQLEIVKAVGDGLSALDAIQERAPNLVVIDSNLLEDEIQTLLRHVKQAWPAVCCLVLTVTVRQEKWAMAGGADAVWPRHRSLRALTEFLKEICPGP